MSQMIEVNVAEATGAALDWMTGMATGALDGEFKFKPFQPSTDWSQGGPLLDGHCRSFGMVQDNSGTYRAFGYGDGKACDSLRTMRLAAGPTILIAACRAIVTAKLGDKVMVPVELVDNIENVQPGAGMREV